MLASNIKHLRKEKGWTQEELASKLGISRPALGSYEEGRATPKLDVLFRITELFDITLKELKEQDLSKPGAVNPSKKDNLRVLAVTVDREDNENIELVNQKARAGYLAGYADTEYVSELPKFRLPFLPKDATYRAFEIEGDSMLPVQPGDIIICEYVENWSQIKDGETYILLTQGEGIVYKRVFEQIEESDSLILQSDNPSYPPYNVKINEVLEIWKARLCISNIAIKASLDSGDMMNLVRDLQKELNQLKSRVGKN